MAADGQVIFEITGDNSPLKKTLSETTTSIKNESKKWDSAVDDSSGNISSSLTGAFKAVTASAAFTKVGQMLLQLGVESIDLASDLEEVQNVVDVTFGTEGSKKIETWSKNASSQFGLTELQAKQFSSTLGAMMKSSGLTGDEIVDMSTNLAGLAADMASFYNLDFDTAFEKIRSGISGETEPLKQLGINMSVANLQAYALAQGIETDYAKLSQAEQVMIRYGYLLSVTSDAQGDFARTSEGFANSQRRMTNGFDVLKTQLGEALLPIATTVTNAINDLLDIMVYKPPETAFDVAEQSINEAETTATQAKGILGYMDTLYEKYGEAATKTEEWASALGKLQEVMPQVNDYINAETGALSLSNDELRDYIENTKQAAIEAAKQNAIKQLNDEYVQAGMDYYTAEINRDMANAQAKEAAMSLIDYIIAGYKERGIGNTEDTAYLLDRDQWYEGLTNGSVDMRYLMFEAQGVANQRGEDYSTIERYQKIYEEQTAAASDAAKEMANLQGKMQELETDLAIANAALEKLSSAAAAAASSLAGAASTGGPTSGFHGRVSSGISFVNGAHAGGLNYVPFDGYTALLHKGERVQTAAEASLSRMNGIQQPGVDYGTVGAAMWANAPKAGGNVFLDGRIVGQVISDMQAKSYRSLQRSGWQA